ncbi:MAG TPA: hypothetical protein VFQ68_19220 [Streptosporangiaceae bacterium]|nr:hypothetical protein [Streptosporangiaceae bacterium]
MDEPAAWHELEAAISGALWRYAEAVTGVQRDSSGEPVAASSFEIRGMYLARLSAARRVRGVLAEAEAEGAAGAFRWGASYPMVAEAMGISRQNAWKRYRGSYPRPEAGPMPGPGRTGGPQCGPGRPGPHF